MITGRWQQPKSNRSRNTCVPTAHLNPSMYACMLSSKSISPLHSFWWWIQTIKPSVLVLLFLICVWCLSDVLSLEIPITIFLSILFPLWHLLFTKTSECGKACTVKTPAISTLCSKVDVWCCYAKNFNKCLWMAALAGPGWLLVALLITDTIQAAVNTSKLPGWQYFFLSHTMLTINNLDIRHKLYK